MEKNGKDSYKLDSKEMEEGEVVECPDKSIAFKKENGKIKMIPLKNTKVLES